MNPTTWTATREQLVRDLQRARAQQQATAAELTKTQQKNRALETERDNLRQRSLTDRETAYQRIIAAETARAEAEADAVKWRQQAEQSAALVATYQADIDTALGGLAQASMALRRVRPAIDAERNRLSLIEALNQPRKASA